MFSGVTLAAIITQGTTLATELASVILIVLGVALFFMCANWVVAKFRRR